MAKPRGGARPGAGNPGYGKSEFIKQQVERLTPHWFALIEAMMNNTLDADPLFAKVVAEDRRFALGQIGRLVEKLLPTTLATDPNNPLVISISPEAAQKYAITPTPKANRSK